MWEKTRNLLIPALLLDLIDSNLIGFRFKAESLHYYIQCNEIFILLLMGLKGDEEVRCWVSCEADDACSNEEDDDNDDYDDD